LRQKEWERWRKKLRCLDGSLVTEGKLVTFLDKEVIHRELRRRKRQRTRDNGEAVKQTLGKDSINAYVNAIVALYSVELSMKINHNHNPRGAALKALLDSRFREEHERNRAEFKDRGARTFLDGYTAENMYRIVRYCWQGGEETSRNVAPLLRTVVDFLIGNYMMVRPHYRRDAELPDFFAMKLPEE